MKNKNLIVLFLGLFLTTTALGQTVQILNGTDGKKYTVETINGKKNYTEVRQAPATYPSSNTLTGNQPIGNSYNQNREVMRKVYTAIGIMFIYYVENRIIRYSINGLIYNNLNLMPVYYTSPIRPGYGSGYNESFFQGNLQYIYGRNRANQQYWQGRWGTNRWCR